jgi:hypothetical protein
MIEMLLVSKRPTKDVLDGSSVIPIKKESIGQGGKHADNANGYVESPIWTSSKWYVLAKDQVRLVVTA